MSADFETAVRFRRHACARRHRHLGARKEGRSAHVGGAPIVMVGLGPTIHEFRSAKFSCGRQTRDGVDGPRTASMCQSEATVRISREGGRPWRGLSALARIRPRESFRCAGVDAEEQPVLKKQLRRSQVAPFASRLAHVFGGQAIRWPARSARYWARTLEGVGPLRFASIDATTCEARAGHAPRTMRRMPQACAER